jgi:hypothetical protein
MEPSMDEIRIPNQATYSPIALTDLAIAAPILSRLLLGATLPGRVLQAAALGAYVGSAVTDWFVRQGVRRIDFKQEFGADVDVLEPMPREEREREVQVLTALVNDHYTAATLPRAELAATIANHLTDYIAAITGQRVETSAEVRSFGLAKLVFPFALGAYDIFSGDIAIFQPGGVFEPHVIAHEFCHRKGYWKELHAQALAYLAMTASGDPLLVQSARCERLLRNVRVLSGDDPDEYDRLVAAAGLRPELEKDFLGVRPKLSQFEKSVEGVLKTIYDERMKLTGQNGISDYDLGFTNFLYTFETGSGVRQRPPAAGRLR